MLRRDQEPRPNGLLFRLRRVTFKKPGAGPTKSNQKCLLSVWPFLRQGSFTPVSLRGPAPNGHPCPQRRSRRIHAARPTPRDLRSACTQVAIGGDWAFCVRRSKANQKQIRSRSEADQKKIRRRSEADQKQIRSFPAKAGPTNGSGCSQWDRL